MFKSKSNRLQNWDYGSNATYFVTICTARRFPFFGVIHNKRVILSEIGEIANHYWEQIPVHFPFVRLEEFVVMPDHVHGLLRFFKDERATPLKTTESVSDKKRGGKNSKWKPGILGVVINQYKRICTIEARKIRPDFAWQSRFHEQIIRDPVWSVFVGRYIENNPANYIRRDRPNRAIPPKPKDTTKSGNTTKQNDPSKPGDPTEAG